MRVSERITPITRTIDPASIEVPAGYSIRPVLTELNYPTSVSWDVDGNLLIAEGGLPGHGVVADTERRILRLEADGSLTAVAGGFTQLINDITVYRGMLYVSHRGKISVLQDGCIRDLVVGLPSYGMYQNTSIVFDTAGRMYFGQGTVSNAGVVGPLALADMEELTGALDAHDIPGASVVLTGQNYEVEHPRTGETRLTGAFSPWGTPTPAGHRIPGPAKGQAASGAIMRANWDGSDLRVYAWGFRYPFGLAFGPEGRLYATNAGANPLPPRPVAGDPDTLWLVEEGQWYGWPDYFAGRPITDPSLQAPGAPRQEFLIANHEELLGGQPRPHIPVTSFGEMVSAAKLDFCLHPGFGFVDQAFVAEFGPVLAPMSGMPPDLSQGFRVVRVDVNDGTVYDFAVNRGGGPASASGGGGLERPIEAKFGPDANLYIVDLGILRWQEGERTWEAIPGTGVVWQVSRTG